MADVTDPRDGKQQLPLITYTDGMTIINFVTLQRPEHQGDHSLPG